MDIKPGDLLEFFCYLLPGLHALVGVSGALPEPTGPGPLVILLCVRSGVEPFGGGSVWLYP